MFFSDKRTLDQKSCECSRKSSSVNKTQVASLIVKRKLKVVQDLDFDVYPTGRMYLFHSWNTTQNFIASADQDDKSEMSLGQQAEIDLTPCGCLTHESTSTVWRDTAVVWRLGSTSLFP